MAPLSRFLSGIILKHDTFGSHLNSNGKTVDLELEKKNFFAAMEVVSEVWSKTDIDKHPVDCKPVEIGCKSMPDEPEANWVAKHVIQGRYMKQIVKCDDTTCCSPFQTNWREIFPTRFIPPPVPCKFSHRGLEVIEISDYKEKLKLESDEPILSMESAKIRFASLQERLIANLTSKEARLSQKGVPRPPPFDAYCPSMMEKIDELVCLKCGSSWPSIAAKKRHLKAHKKGQKKQSNAAQSVLDLEAEFVSDEDIKNDEKMSDSEQEISDSMPVFSINSYLKSIYPFEEVKDEID